MSERTAVQNPMLHYADAIVWDFMPATEALQSRCGESSLFFTEILRSQLLRLNPGIVDESRADWIIRQLTLLRADITGNRDALLWLRGEKSVFVPEENRERNVRLVDFDDLTKNVCHVTDKWTQRNPRQRPDVPAILIGHFSVNEASHGSEHNIMIGRDAAIPRSILADPAFRYVALGHIHKHQSLNADLQPPVIYSGSIERIDFGEEHEPKGFVAAEIGDGTTMWEFVRGYKRQARPFVTVRVDVSNAADPTAAVIAAISARGDLSDTVVRIVVKLRQEQESLLVEREIMRALEGAYFVASLQKDIERTERQRLDAVSVESLTPAQLLERYLQVKEVSEERAKLLQRHGEALIQAVDGTMAP